MNPDLTDPDHDAQGVDQKTWDQSSTDGLHADRLKIGLALSGGGVRATVFHLGLLGRLAAEQMLERVTFISTVSGGSLGTGLVYSLAGNQWPTSQKYTEEVAPQAKHLLTSKSIQTDLIYRTLTRPWHLFRGRAKLVSESVQHSWGVTGLLTDLPLVPRWIINATAYESGSNWRFMPQRMGDYKLNYVQHPPVLIADAVAASAAFPGLIGYLALKTDNYEWVRYLNPTGEETEPIEPRTSMIHLWDGGVYDNLGTEALFKMHQGLRNGINFLIVSDASGELRAEEFSLFYKRVLRLVGVAMEQVRSLRSRAIVSYFQRNPQSGVYLRIGNSADYILRYWKMAGETSTTITHNCLPASEAIGVAQMPTTLRRLTTHQYERLYRHGWEVADCTLVTHCPDLFKHLPFRR